MIEPPVLTSNLILACSVYCLGVASPGPSNLSVMASAMNEGRRTALTLSAGIVLGSLVWGLLAAFGLAALLATYSQSLISVKIVGSFYLLWLSYKSLKRACGTSLTATLESLRKPSQGRTILRGFVMHLTNPKAVLVWTATISLALPDSARSGDAVWIVTLCTGLGICIFCSYALLFSMARARDIYAAVRRYLEGSLALLFAVAGVQMLLTDQSAAR